MCKRALRREHDGFDDIIHVYEGELIGVVPDDNQPLTEANTQSGGDERTGLAPNLAGTKNDDRQTVFLRRCPDDALGFEFCLRVRAALPGAGSKVADSMTGWLAG